MNFEFCSGWHSCNVQERFQAASVIWCKIATIEISHFYDRKHFCNHRAPRTTTSMQPNHLHDIPFLKSSRLGMFDGLTSSKQVNEQRKHTTELLQYHKNVWIPQLQVRALQFRSVETRKCNVSLRFDTHHAIFVVFYRRFCFSSTSQ